MFPNPFTSVSFFQKKRDIVLYRAEDASHKYILKTIITKDPSVKQAFYDEYSTLSSFRHPSVPIYYGITEHFQWGKKKDEALALCMEDCSPGADSGPFCAAEVCEIMHRTAEILGFLLDHGILYTDLHPSNLIVKRQKEGCFVTLVDYTYCYYFLRNPHPDYTLRFSYDLSPRQKGQQMLIQALSFLFYDLIETHGLHELPSSVYCLLETGRNPSADLTLSDFTDMLKSLCGEVQDSLKSSS